MTMTDRSAPTSVLHGIRAGRAVANVRASPEVRVLLADSQVLVRAGVRLLLEATGRIAVVGEAAGGEEAVAMAGLLRPDVVLIDATLPGLDRVQAIRRISSESRVAVIVLIASQDDEHTLPAVRAGAAGLLPKGTEPAELVRAVEILARGGALLPPTLTRRLIAELASRPEPVAPSPSLLDELTAREREVVALVGHGLANDEIAERLPVSPATAKTHVSRAMVKLNAHDRAKLVVFAYETGLVRPRTAVRDVIETARGGVRAPPPGGRGVSGPAGGGVPSGLGRGKGADGRPAALRPVGPRISPG